MAGHSKASGNEPTEYERFKAEFKNYLAELCEELGEAAFFERYPIKGFDEY